MTIIIKIFQEVKLFIILEVFWVLRIHPKYLSLFPYIQNIAFLINHSLNILIKKRGKHHLEIFANIHSDFFIKIIKAFLLN